MRNEAKSEPERKPTQKGTKKNHEIKMKNERRNNKQKPRVTAKENNVFKTYPNLVAEAKEQNKKHRHVTLPLSLRLDFAHSACSLCTSPHSFLNYRCSLSLIKV